MPGDHARRLFSHCCRPRKRARGSDQECGRGRKKRQYKHGGEGLQRNRRWMLPPVLERTPDHGQRLQKKKYNTAKANSKRERKRNMHHKLVRRTATKESRQTVTAPQNGTKKNGRHARARRTGGKKVRSAVPITPPFMTLGVQRRGEMRARPRLHSDHVDWRDVNDNEKYFRSRRIGGVSAGSPFLVRSMRQGTPTLAAGRPTPASLTRRS